MAGYIKIHKKLRDWRWYSVPAVRDTFLHLIIIANYKDGYFKEYEVKRGQAIFSYASLSAELGFSIQQIRTAIKKLIESGEIVVWSNKHISLATITKYDEYQQTDNTAETQINSNKNGTPKKSNNKQTTNKQQSNNNQITTSKNIRIEEVNNKEKEIIKKEKVGTFKNVLLSANEIEKLKSNFDDWHDRIDRLSEYIESSGKKYKSHYAVILTWARKDKAEKKPDKRGGVYSTSGASFDVSKFEESSMFDD